MTKRAKPFALICLTLAAALLVSACQRVAPAGIATAASPVPSPPQTQPGPASEVVAIASSHARSNPRARLGAVRMADSESLAAFLTSYASGDDDILAADLRAQISEVPTGKTLVGGVISIGCDIPGSAVLVEQDDKIALLADGLPAEPTPECAVANMTVAIVAADFADVPGGSTGFGDLIHFQPVASGDPDGLFPLELTSSDTEFLAALDLLTLGAPELPTLQPADRRFAFLLTGCANDAAELQVTVSTISAGLTTADPPASVTLCDAPQHYLTALDVAANLVPEIAALSVGGKYRSDTFQRQRAQSFDRPHALEITENPDLIKQTWGINQELLELAPDTRRFAFLLYGCQDDWAQMTVKPTSIHANLGKNRSANQQVDCIMADIYLATFDVPTAEIPATAALPDE